MPALVDVVVVSYNSRDTLRACVERLTDLEQVRVIVVDNNSPDRSLESIADLPVTQIQLDENGGFARGTNAGWRAGSAPYVLILNPDTELTDGALDLLVARIEGDSSLGAVAPRIVSRNGETAHSLRRFPSLRSTYSQAFFLHRLFPTASWVDEVIRDPQVYAAPYRPDWFSGACILVRRRALESIGGLDERFFLYCEDIDLCHRLRDEGFELLYDPAATCVHQGGASADRSALLRILAESRVLYAYKYYSRPAAVLARLGVAIGATTHAVVSRSRRRCRGHLNALAAALFTRSF
jgi:N-acetylglucosaminyl-diphospho-decaprenol L-rhamnosyltransferase